MVGDLRNTKSLAITEGCEKGKMYFEKVIISGDVIEVVKSYTKGSLKSKNRSPKEKKTPEQMAEENQRNAERRLTRLLNCNFKKGDLWVTLTYRRDQRPTPEKAKKILTRFIRRMRYRFERKSEEEMKYITVTEYESKAIHHHMVINNPDDVDVLKLIMKQWKDGVVHIVPLYSQGNNFKDLAAYMIKETSKTFRKNDGGHKRRYMASRNLKKPIIRYRVVRAKRWTPYPRAKKGYRIDTDSIVNGVNGWTGREYQSYTMVRLE